MISDERLMELAQPFASDGGRWPSDWIGAMRVAIHEAKEVEGFFTDHQVHCIQIEKKLCAALGRTWEPAGMSIDTLVDDLVNDKYQNRAVS